MNLIGIDDFELEQLEKNPQISEEEYKELKMKIKNFKMETLKREMGISKEDRDRLTKTLKEMNAYAKNKK